MKNDTIDCASVPINLDYEKEIFEIVKNNPQRYGRMLRAKGGKACGNTHGNPCRLHLLQYVLEQTSFLDQFDPLLRVRLMYLWTHCYEIPKCVICGKPVPKIEERYCGWPTKDLEFFLSKQTCCKDHAYQMAKQSREKYFSENYGDGITNVSQLPETIEKIHQTKLENHGDPNYNNSELNRQNCRKKYGYDFFFQTDEFKNLSKGTKIERYGVDHHMKCPEIVDGMRERYRAAHGVDYSTQNPEVISKARRKYIYDEIWFDSGWEVVYYKYLTDIKANFIYHPMEEKFVYMSNGKEHRYYPDFLVDGKYVELKSDKTYETYATNLNAKWNTVEQQAMQDKFKLMSDMVEAGILEIWKLSEMRFLFDWIREKTGMTYKKWVLQFKNK